MTAAAKTTAVSTEAKKGGPLTNELAVLEREVLRVLPSHVGVDKFIRVVTSALTQDDALFRADRKSLYQAALKCAQDGLLPDGREAAFAIFKTKDKRTGRYVDKVQYMPMTFGILKKVRNSGELKSLTCNVVFDRDTFRYWVDDEGEHITHEPNLDVPDRGKVRAAYAIAKTKDEGVYTEVMTRGQIEQTRACSKAKDSGPWVEWYDEMARNKVTRRLSKRLPMSTDLERTIRRTDEMDRPFAQTQVERSGSDAARHLLGILPEGDSPPPTEDEPEYVQQFTDDAALAAIAAATTVEVLKDTWVRIANDYIETDRELPVQLESAYSDRMEALLQKQGKPA